MQRKNILFFIKKLGRPVFTTPELAICSGKSLSAVTQALNYLQRQGVIFKVTNGIWAEAGNKRLSAYSVIPFLLPRHRSYVSFLSALHLHGLIEQIPQVITLATTSHTKLIRTKLGDYSFHQISPMFFTGFDWYKNSESFLIAEPEKALVDCLYLSAHKGRRFHKFPELTLPKSFSIKKVKYWAGKIRAQRTRKNVLGKLNRMF